MERMQKELSILEAKGQLRKIPLITNKNDNKIEINGKTYVNLASNDYLGISTNKELVDEFLSMHKNFFSSASARLLSGTSSEYNELEQTLANLFNKEGCLLFNTGYQCNLGIVSTLCQKGDVVFSDKLNHASIIDGMKLAEGDFIRYRHLDYKNLEELLSKKRNSYNRAIIISESVFSMDGDIADIDKLIELKKKYNCLLMIDEAHAFCAIGKDLTGISCGDNIDIITATFGKAVGSFGAFCVANYDIITYLTNKARSFIFSTSIPPINVAWTNWLLNQKREYLLSQKAKLNILCNEVHLLIESNSKSQIIPFIIGTNDKTNKIAENLKSEGYYIPAIRPPTVPNGTSRLRVSLTANTDLEDVKRIIKIIHEF